MKELGENMPSGHVLQSLQTQAPVFFTFAGFMCAEDCVLLKPILESLEAPHSYLSSFEPHQLGPAYAPSSLEFFPKLPLVNCRGSYEMDKKPEAQKLCDKVFPSHKSLSPGIFSIHCPHGE